MSDGVDPPGVLLDLAAALRSEGLEVAAEEVAALLSALGELSPLTPAALYLAARATLVHRAEDLAAFHRSFARTLVGQDPVAADSSPADQAAPRVSSDAGRGEGSEPAALLRWSPTERLRRVDVASCEHDELEDIWRLIARWRPPDRRRRQRRSGAGPSELDLRRSLTTSLRGGGEILLEWRRRPRHRPGKVVMLVDVSGSMTPYAGTWLRFAQALVRHDGAVEVFAAATRLTRITPALRRRDPDEALRLVASTVPDMAGGTRLGDALDGLRRWSSPASLLRGADLVVLSDGWDGGDPEVISTAMARLRLVTRRMIWANPWKASEGFEPIARGMAAALDHVDGFVEGHSLAALESLVALLGTPAVPDRRGAPIERSTRCGSVGA